MAERDDALARDVRDALDHLARVLDTLRLHVAMEGARPEVRGALQEASHELTRIAGRIEQRHGLG